MIREQIYDIQKGGETIGVELPSTVLELLNLEEPGMETLKTLDQRIKRGLGVSTVKDAELIAPIPNPPSCRDAYAFRQHVATARRNRGVPMIPEFDQYPIFYFTNHNAIFGGGEVQIEADHIHKLDFELEVAIVIGKRGKNISSQDADNYIAGYTIMNDLSARLLQMEEMKLNLGPAKGKDFATTIGPWLVTPDELAEFKIENGFGVTYSLGMQAFHNGTQISEGNMKDMTWTFAEIIERASYGVELYPGDVIGSGTVGSGCYLELNGTAALEAKEAGKDFTPTWLVPGDMMELRIDGLGALSNTMVASGEDHSILAIKKMG
ncbi:MAG: fumarylacetoacetate hydrolase family protein [Candidatus Marinimicrobia bacterium]|nr:fumarylacetoacetate hydrolase family protein [Candidatus Neomarinimicrobiota bacterium]MBT4715829.1 fumarylacetoacetate hydrolase family protein [Candidatus Neomarinimicrobiota bacterium]MBT4947830.1 fumarylacetoacetate hydrolase family protein [Candidatus Neomarinimicrobiota bacterium]MBT5271317.1 fumarylacetoacetate hydrolase family protein [Candidatus Neomarinimicrobiota bacterium]MBT6009892.1 fumarylacetoacetate hydrolase family protein [Candidatus Neomarinimicrobiota bacterium]